MKVLIAEDDFASRLFMKKFLSKYGECDVVVDGIEAVDAYLNSINEGDIYDLICLDIMMPKADGMKVLKTIREIEKRNGIKESHRVKIIIMTALNDTETIDASFELGCEAFITKPIEAENLISNMKFLGLIG